MLLSMVGLMKTLSNNQPIMRYWLIVFKEPILISKSIACLLTQAFLSYKYVKRLLMHNTDNFCFGVKVQYQIQILKKKHINHSH